MNRDNIPDRETVLRILKKTGFWAWTIISVAISVFTVLSAQGGRINPEWWTFPAILAMTFPFWFVANIVIGTINFFVRRKASIVQGVALILSLGAFWTFCPLNIFHSSLTDEEESKALKLMTFNTFGFYDDEKNYPDNTNRTATTIINSGADIVCLQEIGIIYDMPARHLTTAQIDSINEIYPYYAYEEERMVAVLSKYPIKEIELPQHESKFSGSHAALVDFKGHQILVVSVHLQSIGLNDEDRLIYHELTEGSSGLNWTKASKMLYGKLAYAFRQRAQQAHIIRHALDSLGYGNVIVAGDFNDISGCYAMRTIEGGKMKSAYSRAGFGPIITYHSNRFYFNIDHILYQGDMKIADIRRGNIKSSDHYPVYATFTFSDKN